MTLAESSKNEGTGINYANGDTTEREKVHENSSDFFADAPSEYIDSSSILPASESREQLNHFFDETTSTTPAENAEILQQESARDKGEPETFGETQVGKFLKNLFTRD
jgi:hypothetical protein